MPEITLPASAYPASWPVPYALTPQAEALLAGSEPEPELEAGP
ncbi:MAG: hypothetical protein ACRDPY_44970 [Streptosporangiaceae bacterium]